MIICLCRRISDRDIRASVAAGTRNFELLQDETGLASACGSCHDCARELFDAALGLGPSRGGCGGCGGSCACASAAAGALQAA